MILNFFFYILNNIFELLAFILPAWNYPPEFAAGIKYLVSCLMSLNFIFPVFNALAVLGVIIGFELVYYPAKIISKLIFKDRMDI